jgi:hypothetical protein
MHFIGEKDEKYDESYRGFASGGVFVAVVRKGHEGIFERGDAGDGVMAGR